MSQISSWGWTLDEDLAFYEQHRIDNAGIAFRKLEASGDPLDVSSRRVCGSPTCSHRGRSRSTSPTHGPRSTSVWA
jgi:hypothetical protein